MPMMDAKWQGRIQRIEDISDQIGILLMVALGVALVYWSSPILIEVRVHWAFPQVQEVRLHHYYHLGFFNAKAFRVYAAVLGFVFGCSFVWQGLAALLSELFGHERAKAAEARAEAAEARAEAAEAEIKELEESLLQYKNTWQASEDED